MAKKKAAKKASRKVSPHPDMQTLPQISVMMANDILKRRKTEMAGSVNEVNWDPCLEDLWRSLVSTYWLYGEKQTKSFLKTELSAIKRIYRTTSK